MHDGLKRRLIVLNLYLPICLSLYNGVGRSLPTTDINSAKTVIIYILCSLPMFLVAHVASYMSLGPIVRMSLPKQLSLVIGAGVAVIAAYFYLMAFSYCVWRWVPWLESGFSYKLSPSIGDFGVYLRSSTSLLLVPVWFCANLIYEYASKNTLYFDVAAQALGEQTLDEGNHSSTQPIQQPIGILAKLPPHLGREFIALEAQQHYVKVYTASGNELVLYRFGDAVTELEALNFGVQVHRSYVVSPAHIVEAKKQGRSSTLVMSNGLEVPVSQSYRGLVSRFYDHSSAQPLSAPGSSAAH